MLQRRDYLLILKVIPMLFGTFLNGFVVYIIYVSMIIHPTKLIFNSLRLADYGKRSDYKI